MVTNLPAEAKAQWKKVSEAKTPEEKLRELKRFYSFVPKHKGTKNILRQVTRQMAALREEVEIRKRKKIGTYISEWNKPKHGVARTVFLSTDPLCFNVIIKKIMPHFQENQIKWIFQPKYTMFGDEMLQFQTVFLPPLDISPSLDYKIFNFVKTSDIILSVSLKSEENILLNKLLDIGIDITPQQGSVRIKKLATGGIRVIGNLPIPRKKLENTLKNYRIYHAIVNFSGEVTQSDIENEILNIKIFKPGAILSIVNDEIHLLDIVSKNKLKNLGILTSRKLINFILNKLNLIRVFPRASKIDTPNKPIVLSKGSTVIDLAKRIHSRLEKNFRYAIVIRKGFQIKVSKNFVLEDMDIVEIRA